MQKLEIDIFDPLKKVPSFNTCLELDWQEPTEKAWVTFKEKGYMLFELAYTRSFIYHSDTMSFVNDRGDRLEGYKIDFTIIPAPDFDEIMKAMPINLVMDNHNWFVIHATILGYLVESKTTCPNW